MLRTLTLAAVLSLGSAATALACSCVGTVGEQQLANAMANVEARITLPVQHVLRVEPGVNSDRYTVETTHRVLDPLGLEPSSTVLTYSNPEDGGSCGSTPTIGIVKPFNAFRWGEGRRLSTGGCGGVPNHFAALFQRDGIDRRIPAWEACRDRSDYTERQLERMEEYGEDISLLGTEQDDPMCEFYDYDESGPIQQDLNNRIDLAKARAGISTAQTPPENTSEPSPDMGDLVFGLPIRSTITPDGTRLTRVMIREDFGLGLPRAMDVSVTMDPDDAWSEIEVGVHALFSIDAVGTMRALTFEEEENSSSALYTQVTGKVLPDLCVESRWLNKDVCDPLLDDIDGRMMEVRRAKMTAQELDDALRDSDRG